LRERGGGGKTPEKKRREWEARRGPLLLNLFPCVGMWYVKCVRVCVRVCVREGGREGGRECRVKAEGMDNR